LLFTIQLVGTTLTKPVMGKMSDKYGRKQMISFGLILGAISLAMIPFFKSFWTLIPAAVMFGISLATVTASTAAFVSDLAKAGSYGSALGVMSTIMDVGHSSGPIISSQLLHYGPLMLGMVLGANVDLTNRASYLSMFIIVALILFLAGILFPILVGKPKNVESEIPS